VPTSLTVLLFLLVAAAGFAVGDRAAALSPVRHARECWIALWRSGTSAEFRAVVGGGADREIVARSPVFAAPASGAIPDDGPARDAHEDLVARLRELGWEPVGSAVDAWHRVRFEERLAADRLSAATAQ
jgi:hypothetical protein